MKGPPFADRDGGMSGQRRCGPCVSTAIHSRSTPFRDELASHSLQAVNQRESERFHAFAYRCAWVAIEGEEITGYVIT